MPGLRHLRDLVLASVLLAASALLHKASAQSACLPAGPLTAAQLRYVTNLVTGSDTATIRVRTALGLNAASANDVYVVSDSVRCRSAAIALEQTFGDSSGTAAPAWLVQAGPDRLIVFNPLHRDQSGTLKSVVFDTLYVRKSIFVGL